MRRFFHWLFRVVLLLALGTLVWAGWYVYNKGFTKKWRDSVLREFHKRGVEIYFSRLTLDPFNGLVAQNVRIVDSGNHDRMLVAINRISLDINLNNYFHKLPFLNAVDLRNASLALPVDPNDPNGPKIGLTKLNARLLFPPNQVYLSQAEAQISGVHISASGRLINPGAYHPGNTGSAQEIGKASGSGWTANLIKQLNSLKFEGEPPRIEIQFGGDLSEPGKIFAQATVWAEKVRRARYRLDSLYALLDYRDGVCNLKQCVAGDARGELDASGSLETATGAAELALRSGMDLQGLASLVKSPGPLDECVFYSAPGVELTARGNIHEFTKAQIAGKIALQKFSIRSVIFEGLNANFSWNTGHWYVDDFKLSHRSGAVSGSAMQAENEFRCKLKSTINPRDLLPIAPEAATRALADLDFEQPPQFELEASGTAPRIEALQAAGEIKLGRTKIRGSPFNAFTSKLLIKDRSITFQQFKVDRDEGGGAGTLAIDLGRKEVRLDHIKTNLVPLAAAYWVNRELPEHVAPYRFRTPPNLLINGVVQFDGGKNTNLEILIDASGGLDYTFLKRNLFLPKLTGRLWFTDDRLRITDLEASLYSGHLRGSADISLKKGAPGHSARIIVEDVNFPALTKLYFNYDTSKGSLSGNYDFSGRGDDGRAMQGRGSVKVVDGDVFSIPIFGPLSGILNTIVPGMGYNIAHEATASFEVHEGVIETRDFRVKGMGFQMLGGGKLFFLDDKINFNIRINAQGIPGVVLFPVSKLLEYESNGLLSKPVWRPARLPSL